MERALREAQAFSGAILAMLKPPPDAEPESAYDRARLVVAEEIQCRVERLAADWEALSMLAVRGR